MNEASVDKINEINGAVEEIVSTDSSMNDELGPKYGFHTLFGEAFNAADSARSQVEFVKRIHEEIRPEVLKWILSLIAGRLHKFNSMLGAAKQEYERLKILPAPDEAFNTRRASLNKEAVEFNEKNRNEYLLMEMTLASLELRNEIQQLREDGSQTELQEKVKSIDAAQQEAIRIVQALGDLSAKVTYDRSRTSYGRLSSNHAERSRNWLILSGFAALASVLAAGWVVVSTTTATTLPEALMLAFRKTVALASPLLVLKIALTKYNAERHLKILYDHRQTALEELDVFEKAISNEAGARTQLRIEAAKMLLSDPATSYAAAADSTELNISPIFSAVEKAVGKGS